MILIESKCGAIRVVASKHTETGEKIWHAEHIMCDGSTSCLSLPAGENEPFPVPGDLLAFKMAFTRRHDLIKSNTETQS